MSGIRLVKCTFCHKKATVVCETRSVADKCSRALVKIRQTVLRIFRYG
jgi:hypothetical protein